MSLKSSSSIHVFVVFTAKLFFSDSSENLHEEYITGGGLDDGGMPPPLLWLPHFTHIAMKRNAGNMFASFMKEI